MRKFLYALVLLLIVGAVGFFTLGPGMIEKSMNKVDGKPLPKVSAEAIALHKTLTIVDLHSDTLMWKRDLLDRADRGHMDVPRLVRRQCRAAGFFQRFQNAQGAEL